MSKRYCIDIDGTICTPTVVESVSMKVLQGNKHMRVILYKWRIVTYLLRSKEKAQEVL